MKSCTILAIVVLVCMACTCVNAAGEWTWIMKTNPSSGNLSFSGIAGSTAPIIFTGTVYNNDQAGNTLSFDGLTLKTDELQPTNEGLFAQLLKLDDSIVNPGSCVLGSGRLQKITIGIFDLTSAAPGTYTFKLIGAGSYDSVQPSPDQITSDMITVTVAEVPEPASIAALLCAVVGFAIRRRR